MGSPFKFIFFLQRYRMLSTIFAVGKSSAHILFDFSAFFVGTGAVPLQKTLYNPSVVLDAVRNSISSAETA